MKLYEIGWRKKLDAVYQLQTPFESNADMTPIVNIRQLIRSPGGSYTSKGDNCEFNKFPFSMNCIRGPRLGVKI